MHRATILVSSFALLLGGAVASDRLAAGAQEGMPTPGPVVDVAIGVRGAGQPEAAPGHELALRRVVFAPGGSIADHVHPGALVLSVESGALTYSIVEGTVAVERAAQDGTPGPTELFGPGDETVLAPGDSLFEQSIVHSARNDGDEPAVVWVSSVMEGGEPFSVFRLP